MFRGGGGWSDEKFGWASMRSLDGRVDCLGGVPENIVERNWIVNGWQWCEERQAKHLIKEEKRLWDRRSFITLEKIGIYICSYEILSKKFD